MESWNLHATPAQTCRVVPSTVTMTGVRCTSWVGTGRAAAGDSISGSPGREPTARPPTSPTGRVRGNNSKVYKNIIGLTNGYSLGMALAIAVALASYALGLLAASAPPCGYS
jgi:hypothetical protein